MLFNAGIPPEGPGINALSSRSALLAWEGVARGRAPRKMRDSRGGAGTLCLTNRSLETGKIKEANQRDFKEVSRAAG